jgi:hypothetical protein
VPAAGQGLALGSLTRGTRLDNLSVSLRSGPADTRVAATLTLATSLAEQDAGLELDLPAGAQVTFLAITMGGERRIAHHADAEDARETYQNIVDGIEHQDPALLELVESNDATDKLRLRVFPLVRGKPAKVELIMTVPQTTRFVVDPGKRSIPRVEIEADGKYSSYRGLAIRRAVALPEAVPGALPAEVDDKVTADRALFIDLPPRPEVPDEEEEEVFRPERLGRAAAQARRARGAFRVSEDCLRNALCDIVE